MLPRLDVLNEQRKSSLLVSGVVVDVSVLTRQQVSIMDNGQPEAAFDDLIDNILQQVQTDAEKVRAKRVDVVQDLYDSDSIKCSTRSARWAWPGSEIFFPAGVWTVSNPRRRKPSDPQATSLYVAGLDGDQRVASSNLVKGELFY